ncbi:hypothetical protein [Candidatus Poriferisodalis sp.]|uniref:hypothetical protein n=1 Tax=Candidatus Poriferisodalis sp. TaxID=3101277 RepID=UPI003AF6E334
MTNRAVPGRVGLIGKRGGYAPTRDWPEDIPIEDVYGPVNDSSDTPEPADSTQSDDA